MSPVSCRFWPPAQRTMLSIDTARQICCNRVRIPSFHITCGKRVNPCKPSSYIRLLSIFFTSTSSRDSFPTAVGNLQARLQLPRRIHESPLILPLLPRGVVDNLPWFIKSLKPDSQLSASTVVAEQFETLTRSSRFRSPTPGTRNRP
jgi:hypothetical protein